MFQNHSKPIAPKVQSRTSSRNTTCLSCSNGNLTVLQNFSKAPFTSVGVNKCLSLTMNRANCEKQASISSCVCPLLRYWLVIEPTRLEETRVQQKRMPPLFFHSLGVLSYCTVMLDWGRHWPCFSKMVSACEIISQVELLSFLVPGKEMMNKANLPWHRTRLTLSFTFWKVPNSFPFMTAALRGMLNLFMSMASAMRHTWSPWRRLMPLHCQYKSLSAYWARRCSWNRSTCAFLALRCADSNLIIVWWRTHTEQAACWQSARKRMQLNSCTHTLEGKHKATTAPESALKSFFQKTWKFKS